MNDPVTPTDSVSAPPPLPVEVQSPFQPLMAPKRPVVIKVFGILNIVLAGLALVSLPMTFVMLFKSGGQESAMMANMLPTAPEYLAWMRILMVVGLVFAALQLYGGIGLLKAREGARKLTIACALYGIIAALVGGYLNVKYVLPFSMDNALKQLSGPEADVAKNPAFVQMMSIVTKASTYMGIVMGMLPPLANLFFLSRKPVRDYCQQQTS